MPGVARRGQSDKCSFKPVRTKEAECKGEQKIGGVYSCPEASVRNRDVWNLVLRQGAYSAICSLNMRHIHDQTGCGFVSRLIIDCSACGGGGRVETNTQWLK